MPPEDNAAIDAVDSILAKVLVPLIKAKIPAADDALIAEVCRAVGNLLIDLAAGLAPPAP